jgi:hypothetical protein
MKLAKIALSLVALTACSGAFSGTDVAFQEVLDRNNNPYIAKGDHDNRIFWSAMIKGIAGARTNGPTQSSNKTAMGMDLVLPRANIYMDAIVNDWTMAHMALNFHQLRFDRSSKDALTFDQTQGLAFYTRAGIFSAFDGLSYRPYKFVDEAYVTIGNLHRNPVFFRMGLGNVDFGLYDKNEILINWTTLFTETQAIFAKLGFMDASGFFGSAYAFRGLSKLGDITTPSAAAKGSGVTDLVNDGYPHINNGGISLGYCMNHGHYGVKVVVDWMYNMLGGVNMFRSLALGAVGAATTSAIPAQSVTEGEAMGMHAGVKAHYNQFDFKANFVMTLKKIGKNAFVLKDKRPMALSAGTGVHFKMGHRPSRFGVGFQMTNGIKNAANNAGATIDATGWLAGIVNEWRGHADWTTEVLKNVTFGVHYSFEHAYEDTLNFNKTPRNVHTALLSLTTKVA